MRKTSGGLPAIRLPFPCTLVPITHGRWLAGQIPGVEARYFDNDDHGSLFEQQFPVARTWLVSQMK